MRYTDQDVLTEISFQVDSPKLVKLGFQPQFDLEQGLRKMLARWRGFRPLSGSSNTAPGLSELVDWV